MDAGSALRAILQVSKWDMRGRKRSGVGRCLGSSRNSSGWRKLKPSAVGGQEELSLCLPWGSEVGNEFWIQGTHPSLRETGMAHSG